MTLALGSKKLCFHIKDEGGYILAKSVTGDEETKDPEYALRREYFQLRNSTAFRKRIDTIISKYCIVLSSKIIPIMQ